MPRQLCNNGQIHPWVLQIAPAFALIVSGATSVQALSTELWLAPGGEVVGDRLGGSVGTAGDVNGDGFDDFIVGAQYSDAGAFSTGRAYVFYGGPGADAVPDLTFDGVAEADFFGGSVGAAGDMNGDGFDDVIVGAARSDANGSDAGRAYVFFGGTNPDTDPDLILTGTVANDYFGTSVGTAGDVNGDGFADVVVGASGSDAAGPEAGQAYVFYGGRTPDNGRDLTFTGLEDFDVFGISVGTAGDVNGDGFDDVIIGAFQTDVAGINAGSAYVFFGGPGADNLADVTYHGESSGDQFGVSLGTAGDVNGDGFTDVVVGAFTNQAGGVDAGRAYVFHGGPDPDSIADLIFTGEAAFDQFGNAVGTAGDVNGDGFDDVIVASHESDHAAFNAGRAYVFFGGPGADTVADLSFAGVTEDDEFGIAVGTAGDVNGDGFDDLIIGADQNDANGAGTGTAYVYLSYSYRLQSPRGGETWVVGQPGDVRWRGRELADLDLSSDGGLSWSTLARGIGGDAQNEYRFAVPPATSESAKIRLTFTGQAPAKHNSMRSAVSFRIVTPHRPPSTASRLHLAPHGQTAGDQYGGSVATAGDVNGDGFDDLIVGAHNVDDGGTDSGSAYVLYGGPGADTVADLAFTGEADFDFFGLPVATAGDVNGDGFDDLIVGAYLNDAGGVDAGRAYVYFGGPGADAIADLVLTGEAGGDNFGSSVGTAGDLNGDGFDDFFAGAPRYDSSGTDAGRAYVYFGGPTPDTTADLIFDGEPGDFLGAAVATAGDVNADGYADLLVSSHFNDTGGSNAGAAYLHYGGLNPDNIADLTFTGEAPGDWFGNSLGPAGDVNGDGFDDMIIGADHNDEAAQDAGRAYVYHGGPTADSIADLILTGEVAFDQFGKPATGAGDVNGDGFGDLIVGAYRSGAGGVFRGRAYVFLGGPGADDVADVTLSGEAPGDLFGKPAGAAGDVNGDGFDDIIVGAASNDAGGTDSGRAYLYDFNRYHVLSPGEGQTWNVGATESITWAGEEPADVWLSVDGGNSYSKLRDNVGGSAANTSGLTVPHQPTRFAKLRITPHDQTLSGSAESDSLFTIEASIELLDMRAVPDERGGVLLSWETDPGPTQLRGYKLERSFANAAEWTVLASSMRETEYFDPVGAAGMRYRLTGINGLGGELLLGETGLAPRAALAAWPLPYRSGDLNLTFATSSGRGGGPGVATVAVFDVQGRKVRTVVEGQFDAGYQATTWDGRADGGDPVPSGVYFVRAITAGETSQVRIVVLR